jgi:hypothetical protein
MAEWAVRPNPAQKSCRVRHCTSRSFSCQAGSISTACAAGWPRTRPASQCCHHFHGPAPLPRDPTTRERSHPCPQLYSRPHRDRGEQVAAWSSRAGIEQLCGADRDEGRLGDEDRECPNGELGLRLVYICKPT